MLINVLFAVLFCGVMCSNDEDYNYEDEEMVSVQKILADAYQPQTLTDIMRELDEDPVIGHFIKLKEQEEYNIEKDERQEGKIIG